MSGLTADLDAALVVRDVIQRVYGDATQTVLDQQAATEVVRALRALGWASLDEVAVLIEAAGGSITVPDRLMYDGHERRVMCQDEFPTGQRFTVSVSR